MYSAGPSYISARSADVILSDVRPIKLKLDALRAINVLLDEFLYTILSTSRSLTTEKLKSGLLKVLPTTLGKAALLEAEIELKAYWERSIPNTPLSPLPPDDADKDFSLQWAFELLRLKCEAYSTMNDTDEDSDAERLLGNRMLEAGNTSSPKAALLAPAALYLTAILECICEHILSNVSRVAARDGSRTSASVQDLFVALCEDDAMYGTFKTLQVYEQIEAMSQVQKPRRSKSFTRGSDKVSSPTRTSSPFADPLSTPSRVRQSSESLTSSVVHASRLSLERTKRKIPGRSSSDSESPRPVVDATAGNGSIDLEEDTAIQQEFDELMRSNSTMKVSLTPDRLKTMEVYNKERNQRNARQGKSADVVPVPEGATTGGVEVVKNGHMKGSSLLQVDEAEEEGGVPPSSYPQLGGRARSVSVANPAISTSSRSRSISISDIPIPSLLTRKSSPSIHPATQSPVSTKNRRQDFSKQVPGMPVRKRGPARNRESLDLDEVMAGSDPEEEEEEEEEAPVDQVPATRSQTKSPHISKTARDLIDFLDSGPPEDELPMPKLQSTYTNASVLSFSSGKKQGGRWRNVISRLTSSGSNERLNGRVNEEYPAPRTPSQSISSSRRLVNATVPPIAFQNSLSRKKSYPNVIVGTPPPPPPSTVTPFIAPLIPSLPASSHTSAEDIASLSPSLSPTSPRRSSPQRRPSATPRKAVPQFEETVAPTATVPQVRVQSTESEKENKAVVRDRSPSSAMLRSTNGHMKPSVQTKLDVQDKETGSLRPSPSPTTPVSPSRLQLHTPEPSGKSSPRRPLSSAFPLPPANVPTPRPVTPQPASVIAPPLSPTQVQDLRRMLTVATTADECRLLVNLWLGQLGHHDARGQNGASTQHRNSGATLKATTPADKNKDIETQISALNDGLERNLVQLFLGGSEVDDDAADALEELGDVAVGLTTPPDTPHIGS